MSTNSSRRDFLKRTTAVTAGLTVAGMGLSAKSYYKVIGANDKLNVAIVGTGGKYRSYLNGILDKKSNTELLYICDVNEVKLNNAKEICVKSLGYTPKTVADFRTILKDKNVDVVFISTPDHWHAPMAIMAMQAGKHVYVEKPCSHNMFENELIWATQKRYNRVVQMGNQQRSTPNAIKLIEKIHNGIIGETYKAVAFYTNGRAKVKVPKVVPVPAGLDWDLYQGPSPRTDYLENTENYLWHWYNWDHGTAEAGNNGTHEIDIARWALNIEYPDSVEVEAEKQHYKEDGWLMYDTMYASYKYANGKEIVWDGKSRNAFSTYPSGRGTLIYGTEGGVWTNQGAYKIYNRNGKILEEVEANEVTTGVNPAGNDNATNRHVRNLFDAIRGVNKLTSPMSEAVISTALTHYANIAYKTGKGFEVDANTGRIYDRDAMAHWKREYELGWEPKL